MVAARLMLKRIALGLLVLFGLVAIAAGGFVWFQANAFDRSMARVYDVPLREVQRSIDPQVLARGEHLANGLGACLGCHGAGGGGGKVEDMMPVARMAMSNITAGTNGALSTYSDAELARLVKHGLRRDGTSVRFMPSSDFSWWPDADVDALISYLRTLPPVDSEVLATEVGLVGKVLDRLDVMPLDVARRIDHSNLPVAPPPSESPEYGKHIASLCKGCHGPTLSGGALPGAPASMPVPLNLTPHESGLKDWEFSDFDKLMRQGIRRNGQKLDPFMPVESTRAFSDLEMKALWEYLRSVPARPFGGR